MTKKLKQKLSVKLDAWLFRPGGQYNAALARIAIAIALLLTLFYGQKFSYMAFHWEQWIAPFQGSGWVPKGLVKLCFGIPPAWFVKGMFILAVGSTCCMLIGLWVPVSQIVATLATIFIVSLETSFGPYWSHAFNVQLLAALAFMFCRSADVLSVSWLFRKWRGYPQLYRGEVYWWPVIFAELATALFMFGAFFQKFRDGGVFWALSDNIRNSLAVSWLQYRSDPPLIVQLLAAEPVLWQSAGAMQLFTQSTTILACFFISYPLFRVVFGGVFFLAEVIALKALFKFWHPFWIPLCFLSIDYEAFGRRIKNTWQSRRQYAES